MCFIVGAIKCIANFGVILVQTFVIILKLSHLCRCVPGAVLKIEYICENLYVQSRFVKHVSHQYQIHERNSPVEDHSPVGIVCQLFLDNPEYKTNNMNNTTDHNI